MVASQPVRLTVPPTQGRERGFSHGAEIRSGWRLIDAADDAIFGMAFFIQGIRRGRKITGPRKRGKEVQMDIVENLPDLKGSGI
jgi:hypothetical protein